MDFYCVCLCMYTFSRETSSFFSELLKPRERVQVFPSRKRWMTFCTDFLSLSRKEFSPKSELPSSILYRVLATWSEILNPKKTKEKNPPFFNK